jgi:PAS domain S-box-containing protein
MVPGFRRDGVWTPAFAGVTALVTFYDFIKENSQGKAEALRVTGSPLKTKKPIKKPKAGARPRADEYQQAIRSLRLSEEKLRASERKYRSLIESIPDIIFALDLDGSLSYIGPHWKKILGHEESEVLGKYFVHFAPAEEHHFLVHELRLRDAFIRRPRRQAFHDLHRDNGRGLSSALRNQDRRSPSVGSSAAARRTSSGLLSTGVNEPTRPQISQENLNSLSPGSMSRPPASRARALARCVPLHSRRIRAGRIRAYAR